MLYRSHGSCMRYVWSDTNTGYCMITSCDGDLAQIPLNWWLRTYCPLGSGRSCSTRARQGRLSMREPCLWDGESCSKMRLSVGHWTTDLCACVCVCVCHSRYFRWPSETLDNDLLHWASWVNGCVLKNPSQEYVWALSITTVLHYRCVDKTADLL